MGYIGAREGVPVPTVPYARAGRSEWVICPQHGCSWRGRPGGFHVCADLTKTVPVPVEQIKAPTPKSEPRRGPGRPRKAAQPKPGQGVGGGVGNISGKVTARIEEVIRRYEDGEGTASLAVDVGVRPEAIRRALKRRGIVLRPAGDEQRGKPRSERRALTDEQTAEMIQRYQAGETMVDLGRAFTINPNTVSKILQREGVQPRPKGPPARPAPGAA